MKPKVRIYDCPANTTPRASHREISNADVVVLRHVEKGLWTLWKHVEGLPVRCVPFDGLPADVKTLVGRKL